MISRGRGEGETNKCVYKCRRRQAKVAVVGVDIASQMTHGNQRET